MNHFWDFRSQKMAWPWNPGERSLRVIGSIRHLCLTFHSNHGPNTPADYASSAGFWVHFNIVYLLTSHLGSNWNWVSAHGSEKPEW